MLRVNNVTDKISRIGNEQLALSNLEEKNADLLVFSSIISLIIRICFKMFVNVYDVCCDQYLSFLYNHLERCTEQWTLDWVLIMALCHYLIRSDF